MPRRGWIVLAVILLAPVVITSWDRIIPERRVQRDGSERTGPGRALRVSDPPETYHIVYLEESEAGEGIVTNTRKVWVRRPFESRIETWRGRPPGERRLSALRSAFGLLLDDAEGADPLRVATPPSIASGDLRPGGMLEPAVDAGLAERRERRRVAGRECQVYRFGGTVDTGQIPPVGEGEDEAYADACFDGRGLLLEELWKEGDEVLRRRVAIEVEVDRRLSDDLFPDEEGDLGEDAGSVERIDADEPIGTWQIDPPAGFRLFGAFDVRFPEAALPPQANIDAPNSRTDVWIRGPDIVVVDQDASLRSLASFGSRSGGRDVGLGLGEGFSAQLFLHLRQPELRVSTPDGSFVRVFATLAPGRVADLGRTLHTGE